MLLQLEDLSLAGPDGRLLLEGLSLSVGVQERVGLTGPSGAGKSLLLRALVDALPEGLQILDCSISTRRPPPDLLRDVGWVPQDPGQALPPFLRIRELLTFLPRALGTPAKDALSRMRPVLMRLRLPVEDGFLDRFPRHLSGGQRQRVALAQALSTDPRFLLLDEPTAHLDTTVQADWMALLQDLHRDRGLGWLWVTHDLGLAAHMTDRLLVLSEGRLVEDGPTAHLLSHPRHPATARLLAAHRESHATGIACDSPWYAMQGKTPLGPEMEPVKSRMALHQA